MRIQVSSRVGIENLSLKAFPANWAVISICDYDEEYAFLKNKPKKLLQLKFDDVGEEIFDEVDYELSDSQKKRIMEKYHFITTEQAFQIATFMFEAIRENIEMIICQCEHGQSRSVAVAAAMSEFLNKDGLKYFTNESYYPQKYVFKQVLNAIKKKALDFQKTKGYLVHTPTFESYTKLKSYFCSEWDAEMIWKGQFPKHYQKDSEIFSKYVVQYVFVSQDFRQIILAGSSLYNPTGGLHDKVEITHGGIISPEKLINYAKLHKVLQGKDRRLVNNCWYFSYIPDEATTQQVANFLAGCGFNIEVGECTVGHNAVSINTVTKQAVFGENTFIAFPDCKSPKGKEKSLEDLLAGIRAAYEISPEQFEQMKETQSKKILPSYIVDLTTPCSAKKILYGENSPTVQIQYLDGNKYLLNLDVDANDRLNGSGLFDLLKKLGFDYKWVGLFSQNHSKLFVDFHHKIARCGVGPYDKKYEISIAQLLEMLKVKMNDNQ